MLLPLIWVVVGGLAAAPDTMVVLGSHSLDLTGNGEAELLEVVGVSESLDSLTVTFTIKSSGRIVYSHTMRPLTRTVGFDAGRRRLSAVEYRQRLEEFGDLFFAGEKFRTPERFVAEWTRMARRHVEAIPDVISGEVGAGPERGAELWDEIGTREATVFEYSAGGDGLVAIAWSESEQRFLTLIECC